MTTDPVGLADLLTRSASRFPQNKALVDGHRVTTYAALDEGASRFAGALDVQPRSRVALLLSNDRSFAEAYYGALRVGATVVPLNPLLKREEVASRLRHSAASVLVTTDARKPELASLAIRTITAGSWSTATAAAARSVRSGGDGRRAVHLGNDQRAERRGAEPCRVAQHVSGSGNGARRRRI